MNRIGCALIHSQWPAGSMAGAGLATTYRPLTRSDHASIAAREIPMIVTASRHGRRQDDPVTRRRSSSARSGNGAEDGLVRTARAQDRESDHVATTEGARGGTRHDRGPAERGADGVGRPVGRERGLLEEKRGAQRDHDERELPVRDSRRGPVTERHAAHKIEEPAEIVRVEQGQSKHSPEPEAERLRDVRDRGVDRGAASVRGDRRCRRIRRRPTRRSPSSSERRPRPRSAWR